MSSQFARFGSTEPVAAAAWAAVQQRDRRADGRFVYAVHSTHIYCRPSCPARRPQRTGVSFYTTPDDAEVAGFRACKRCKPRRMSPLDRHQQATIAACRLLEAADSPLSLATLAAHVDMSPWHFQRTFKSLLGVSPKHYASALQQARARHHLQHEARVTDAVFAAGFESVGRFYARAFAMLGMAPKAFQAGGAGVAIAYGISDTPLGALLVAATDEGVCNVRFGDSHDALFDELRTVFPAAMLDAGGDSFQATIDAVAAHVVTPRPACELPLDIQGTAFQLLVWQVLRGIPAGKTMTYTEVATAVGRPKAHRAVANACAANQLALLIPCHRVVRGDGQAGGYRWGEKRKQQLLAMEQGSANDRRA